MDTSTTEKQDKIAYVGKRPLQNVPAADFVDKLESDFDRNEQFDPIIVFELLNRALEAEGSSVPINE